eukprot:scaffold1636_cov165-Ochromonas_danica.AAC.4
MIASVWSKLGLAGGGGRLPVVASSRCACSRTPVAAEYLPSRKRDSMRRLKLWLLMYGERRLVASSPSEETRRSNFALKSLKVLWARLALWRIKAATCDGLLDRAAHSSRKRIGFGDLRSDKALMKPGRTRKACW